MKNIIFVLGASDPEMNYIEKILNGTGMEYTYATYNGERVKPFSAYKADGTADNIQDDKDIVFVECRVNGVNPVKILDHHKAGDPGFGKDPKYYAQASSLGQLIKFIDMDVEKAADIIGVTADDVRCAMAADHCLSAAYKGKCPGVNPEILVDWRARTRAEFQGVSPESIKASVNEAKKIIETLPDYDLYGHVVKDARDLNGSCRELPEAAAQMGVAVLYRLPMKDKGIKIGILNASPDEVEAFFKWVDAVGLLKPYGDPMRGFAGAYEELPE